jgi:hypothetical protein
MSRILAGAAPCVKTGSGQGKRPRCSALRETRGLTNLPLLAADGCHGQTFVLTLGTVDALKMRGIGHKFVAVAALLALLLPGLSALAETLSADSLACCGTAYCPVHHRQGRDLQKDKSNCNSTGIPGHGDCSMRACDAAPGPAVGTAAFVLVAPPAVSGPSAAEAAPVFAPRLSPFVATMPLTPPPRA